MSQQTKKYVQRPNRGVNEPTNFSLCVIELTTTHRASMSRAREREKDKPRLYVTEISLIL